MKMVPGRGRGMEGANTRSSTVGAGSTCHVLKPRPELERRRCGWRAEASTRSLVARLMPTSGTSHASISWQPRSPGLHAGARKACEGFVGLGCEEEAGCGHSGVGWTQEGPQGSRKRPQNPCQESPQASRPSFSCSLLFLSSLFCLQASHPAGSGQSAILKLSPVSPP